MIKSISQNDSELGNYCDMITPIRKLDGENFEQSI